MFGLDMSDWKTKRQLMDELTERGIVMDERVFRKFVETNNKKFFNHELDEYIAHSSKGYIKTSDPEIIMKSIEDGKKRALNLLWKYSRVMKALGEEINLRVDFETFEIE